MGKTDKSKKQKGVNPYPLDQQINDARFPKPSTRVKVRSRQEEDDKVSVSAIETRVSALSYKHCKQLYQNV